MEGPEEGEGRGEAQQCGGLRRVRDHARPRGRARLVRAAGPPARGARPPSRMPAAAGRGRPPRRRALPPPAGACLREPGLAARRWPARSQAPPPPPSCPDGWLPHAPGAWANPTPSDEKGDRVNTTAAACAKKCALTTGCLAFEVYQLAPKACYIFIGHLQEPFTPNPACFACVSKHAHVPPPPTPPPPPSSTVLIDTSALGLPFEGIGGLNGGNGARLLANYPEPQRSDVLDLLFKPGVGCALDILKVELGADGFAANAGGEPAIRHSKSGPLAFNGTNFFLMREAVKRNRNITLYALSWSFPGWFAGRNALGIDQAEYSADWVDGVREFHGGKVIVSSYTVSRKPACHCQR